MATSEELVAGRHNFQKEVEAIADTLNKADFENRHGLNANNILTVQLDYGSEYKNVLDKSIKIVERDANHDLAAIAKAFSSKVSKDEELSL